MRRVRLSKTFLDQLNTLLEQGRQLDSARSSLLQLSSSHNMLNLAAEYDALHRRLDETYDPLARQSRERSLQMCASRLENARAFSDALERVEAQQEAILQALSSALSSLGRMQLVPDSPGETHELAQAVSEITQQTYAVDKAVAEILTLSKP